MKLKLNKNSFEFLKSTSTVCLLSGLIGLGFLLANKPFWPAFILASAVQYILFSLIAGTVNSYFIHQTRQKELDKLVPLSTILECAACKASNISTFIPDQNERSRQGLSKLLHGSTSAEYQDKESPILPSHLESKRWPSHTRRCRFQQSRNLGRQHRIKVGSYPLHERGENST